MNKNYSCDMIKDLLPGYIDGILSEASINAVNEHLEECETCSQTYLEMKDGLDGESIPNEKIVFDGLKKVRKRTQKLKMIAGIAIGLLLLLSGAVFTKYFIVGEPLSTHQITINEVSYNEDTNCLEVNGTMNLNSYRISRVVWEESKESSNVINVLVYAAETLPFQDDKTDFSISIPDMKGRNAYLACPDYDQLQIYSWRKDHYEQMDELENEIYAHFTELDRSKDILFYIEGIETVNGREGMRYSISTLVGDDATYWRFNDQVITDGEFDEPDDFDIWISLDQPYQILIYDFKTGEYTDDYSIIGRK